MKSNMKPVRNIPLNFSSITGQISSRKNNILNSFESTLERDYLITLEFDSNVKSYLEQPCKIEYEFEGLKSRYTPDVLVNYYEKEGNLISVPTLTEIKYSLDLQKNIALFQPRFNAAKEYAEMKGWKFQVLTENEIRNDFLYNARFLMRYLYNGNLVKMEVYVKLINLLDDFKVTTPEEIILACARDKQSRAVYLYSLWNLIALQQNVRCDLTKKLTMQTEIWKP